MLLKRSVSVSRAHPPLVEFRDFVYRYPPMIEGGELVTALDGVSFSVQPGAVLGVTGTTGSGKSTLCLAMNGIVPHSTGGSLRGDVLIGGVSVKTSSVPELAGRVGLVFQDPESNLVGLTVEDEVAFGPENLGVPPAEIAERVEWSLGAVGMLDARERASSHLSGGQKQRVAIAAVLAMQPELLVLDEPTAQLDPSGKAEVVAAISGLRERAGTSLTVVIVEQDADILLALAGSVLVLDAGRVALEGTPESVLGRVSELRRLGVSAPQIADLCFDLGQTTGLAVSCLTRHDARRALMSLLDDAAGG
jgi:energy-coupling factor transporter ATP-binding protein EcfA2